MSDRRYPCCSCCVSETAQGIHWVDPDDHEIPCDICDRIGRPESEVKSEAYREAAARVRKVFMGGPHPLSPLGLLLSQMDGGKL
jgi:hypothetical protein